MKRILLSAFLSLFCAGWSVNYEAHAYLAGPDVFFPNPVELGEKKKLALKKVNIFGHFPLDNLLTPEDFKDLRVARNKIGAGNEKIMRDCCLPGRIGLILVNMTPWHGPSMDVGTAFEAGYMSALSEKANVIIIGYTDNPDCFKDRVIKHYGGIDKIVVKDGESRGPDGYLIEDFDATDNLMITHAIEKTGGAIVSSFEKAVALAQRLVAERIEQLKEE